MPFSLGLARVIQLAGKQPDLSALLDDGEFSAAMSQARTASVPPVPKTVSSFRATGNRESNRLAGCGSAFGLSGRTCSWKKRMNRQFGTLHHGRDLPATLNLLHDPLCPPDRIGYGANRGRNLRLTAVLSKLPCS
jgi:hypothetical protein